MLSVDDSILIVYAFLVKTTFISVWGTNLVEGTTIQERALRRWGLYSCVGQTKFAMMVGIMCWKHAEICGFILSQFVNKLVIWVKSLNLSLKHLA